MVGAAMLIRRHCLALLTAAVYDACHVKCDKPVASPACQVFQVEREILKTQGSSPYVFLPKRWSASEHDTAHD